MSINYSKSIATVAFTKEGDIILNVNDYDQLDIFSRVFVEETETTVSEIVDFGTLQNDVQIKELAKSDQSCFIRIKPYDQVISDTSVDTASFRFLVVADDLSKNTRIKILSLEEFMNIINTETTISNTLRWILAGEITSSVLHFSKLLKIYSKKDEYTLTRKD